MGVMAFSQISSLSLTLLWWGGVNGEAVEGGMEAFFPVLPKGAELFEARI